MVLIWMCAVPEQQLIEFSIGRHLANVIKTLIIRLPDMNGNGKSCGSFAQGWEKK